MKTSIENVGLGLNLTCSDRETLSQIVRLGMKHDSLSPNLVQHRPNPDFESDFCTSKLKSGKVQWAILQGLKDFPKQIFGIFLTEVCHTRKLDQSISIQV